MNIPLFKDPNREIVAISYIPNTSCNLRCNYCFIHGKNFNSHNKVSNYIEDNDSNIEADAEALYNLSIENDFLINLSLFGGELFLNNINRLTDFIKKLESRIHSIFIQTNGTIINDKVLKFLEYTNTLNKDSNVICSVSLDLPNNIHNKYRCNSYDIVIKNIGRILSHFNYEKNIGIQSTFNNETVDNLNIFKEEFDNLNKLFKNKLIFRFLTTTSANDINNKFLLTKENQIKLAKFMVKYKLAKNFIRSWFTDDIRFLRSCCAWNLECHFYTFRNGKISYCPSIGLTDKFDKKFSFKPIFKNTIHNDCFRCKHYERDICVGGCPTEKVNGKWLFCDFYKELLNIFDDVKLFWEEE